MRSSILSSFYAACLVTLASGTLQARTNFPEVEPNSVKAEATLVACMMPGDKIQGATTGQGSTPGDVSNGSRDYFLVRTCALAPGIYRHRLLLSHPFADSISCSIRGLDQTAGTIGVVDSTVQNLLPATAGIRYVQWYGFGRAEQLFVGVSGTTLTSAAYSLTLETVAVAPVQVSGSFLNGPILLEGNGSADSMVWVYDQSLAPIPTYSNDDVGTFATPFGLTRTYGPGTHFMAVSYYGLMNDQVFANDDHTFTGATYAMDYPDSLVRSPDPNAPTTVPWDVSFRVTDGVTNTQVPATQNDVLEILWFRFEVGSSTPTTVYCLGDGSATACPCGNNSTSAEQAGCAHSFGLGGRLAATGTSSVTADTLTLSGSQMPNSSALYFQGLTRLNGGLGVAFGDGLRCVGGNVIRLGTKSNQAGASSYPASGDVPISVKGLIPAAGGTRTYQCWYRNAASFCTASTFNLSNGVEATWIP